MHIHTHIYTHQVLVMSNGEKFHEEKCREGGWGVQGRGGVAI